MTKTTITTETAKTVKTVMVTSPSFILYDKRREGKVLSKTIKTAKTVIQAAPLKLIPPCDILAITKLPLPTWLLWELLSGLRIPTLYFWVASNSESGKITVTDFNLEKFQIYLRLQLPKPMPGSIILIRLEIISWQTENAKFPRVWKPWFPNRGSRLPVQQGFKWGKKMLKRGKIEVNRG